MTKLLDVITSNPCAFIGFLLLVIIVLDGLRGIVAAARGRRDKNE